MTNPDYEIRWRLFNTDKNQWVDSYSAICNEHDRLMMGRCADFIQNCLRGFGVNLKAESRTVVSVTLRVKEPYYRVERLEYDNLLHRERGLVEAIVALFSYWAERNGLDPSIKDS